jgi:hypothetical protein
VLLCVAALLALVRAGIVCDTPRDVAYTPLLSQASFTIRADSLPVSLQVRTRPALTQPAFVLSLLSC